MPQIMSWEGELENTYKRLGFSGGYPRKIDRTKPSSLMNSEYVKSDGVALYVIGRAGKRINPVKDTSQFINPHYHNPYGNERSAKKIYQSLLRPYKNKLKKLRKR